MFDPHTRESRGFGFVTMENPDDAEAAISALSGTEFMGKSLSIEKARRGRARTPTPGRYYGPPKRSEYERPYDPRPYDSRYSRGGGDRGGDRPPKRYDDDPRGSYGDRDRGYRDYPREPREPRDRYDDRDRRDRGRYDDRRY